VPVIDRPRQLFNFAPGSSFTNSLGGSLLVGSLGYKRHMLPLPLTRPCVH